MSIPVHADARPFTVSAALTRGVEPRMLRRAALDVPFHGVRAPAGSIVDLRSRCHSLLPTLDPGVVFSHVTALQLLGVEVPWALRDSAATASPLHVVTLDEWDRPQRSDVVAHRTRQEFLEVAVVDGLPVTSPPQTFVHVACLLRRPDDVVALGDAMMRYRRSLTSVAELAAIAERTRKVKGIVQVREQIHRMCPGTDSDMETLTRLTICAANLPKPLVNATIRLVDGTHVKRCDLLLAEHRVVIEYDGDQHRSDRRQWLDDVRRRRWLEELGYTVVVVVGGDFVQGADAGRDLDFVSRIRGLLARPPGELPARTPRTVVVPHDPADGFAAERTRCGYEICRPDDV
jgi:very-short-patch-repair endonuclease